MQYPPRSLVTLSRFPGLVFRVLDSKRISRPARSGRVWVRETGLQVRTPTLLEAREEDLASAVDDPAAMACLLTRKS